MCVCCLDGCGTKVGLHFSSTLLCPQDISLILRCTAQLMMHTQFFRHCNNRQRECMEISSGETGLKSMFSIEHSGILIKTNR